ncbi:aromatic amino acid lyase, partial [Escherichia coli]|nr:aromatic amino acid lyase [Escherichia coli]
MKSLTLIPGQLSLSQLRDVYSHPVNITLDSGAFAAIDESVACVNAILAEGRTAYGINTGFGLLAQTRISTEDLENLQRSLVLSHAAGVGEPLDDDLARLIMVLKINSLSRGFSGIRLSVIQALIGLVNAGVTPWIPAKGSVGASGDLAPLAHMSLTLLGEGKARVRGGDWLPATEALRQVGLENYAHAWPDELSGGMRQRVGLARALAINPDILLMDEAFSALDPLIRTEMQDELIKLQAKHQRTIVFISHDLDEAMRIGDRIAIMQNGEVVQVGTPDEILNNPANDY